MYHHRLSSTDALRIRLLVALHAVRAKHAKVAYGCAKQFKASVAVRAKAGHPLSPAGWSPERQARAQLRTIAWLVLQEKLSSAREALDQAVSTNFVVRESAAYALVRAHVALREGKPAEAAHLLQGAMGLPGVKRQLSDVGRSAAIMCVPA